MTHNTRLVSIGEKIHDALRVFARRCDKKNWIWPNLEGGCAVGSYFLLKEAEKLGIDATFMRGCGHVWVESGGYIYDTTAVQFSVPSLHGWCSDMLDCYPKVRVVAIADVPYVEPGQPLPKENLCDLPRHLWGCNRYSTRLHFGSNSNTKDNLWDIEHCWPQGQRVKGYRIAWDNDVARITWKGKNKEIG